MEDEKLILYRLDKLTKDIAQLQECVQEQKIEMAEVKTKIAVVQEDITELKNFILPKKKNGNGNGKIEEKRYEYLLSLVALAGSIIALLRVFIGGR